VDGREAVDVLHRSTLHGEAPAHPERLLRFRPLDPTNRPAPWKTYPGIDAMPLPRDIRRSSLPVVEVLSGERAEPASLDEELLGTLLFLSAGVTRVSHMVDGEPIWFRAAMSAGNLHPVEIYVVDTGVHHYQPLEHALVPLRRDVVDSAPGDGATLVLTGVPFRTGWKYGERGWRHLWWDAGTLLANLLAVADAHGVPARVVAGFDDAAVSELVGIDGIDEVPLVLVRLGDDERPLPPAGALNPINARAEPFARRVLRFPLVGEAQSGGALERDEVAGWREAARGASLPAPDRVPPADGDPTLHLEDVILRRGSSRELRRETAPTALLEWGLAAAARAASLDIAPSGTLIEHLVNVHDVDAAEPGGYRYTAADGFEGRTRVDDARAVSARLCLDQPLGGDSAYTVFHSVELEPLLDALGARGYRAAQLEAGIASGRLALNAVALSGGATGLTFYDRLVSMYFRTDASPLLATAVGIPQTRPAPSGTPGRPAELRGYGNVMSRLSARLRQR
jgi:SagB-type dehydrogenase family enzyme